MAANKFATMLHRNTHKITVILVYAALEWILIILLLLNSLFTYLITKFANYFGLKPPCLWCCRVDHILEPSHNTNSYRELVCDTHATEISRLSFCTNHRKLAETQNMCEDCLASRPIHNDKSIGMTTPRIAFISWVSTPKLGNGDKVSGCCSCCNESLSSKLHPPYLLLKSSWGASNYTHKGSLITEAMDNDNDGDEFEKTKETDSLAYHKEEDYEIEGNNVQVQHNHKGIADDNQVLSDVESLGLSLREVSEEDCSRPATSFLCNEEEVAGNETGIHSITEIHQLTDETTTQLCFGEDDSLQIIDLFQKKYVSCGPDRLIPIELIDLSMNANQGPSNSKEKGLKKQDHQNGAINSAPETETRPDALGKAALHLTDKNAESANYRDLESLETGMSNDTDERKEDLVDETCEQVKTFQEAQTSSTESNDIEAEAMKEPDESSGHKEEIDGFKLFADQTKPKTLISSEGSEHEADIPQAPEPVPPMQCPQDQSSIVDNGVKIIIAPPAYIARNDVGTDQTEESSKEEINMLSEKNQEGKAHHLSIPSEPNEAEEDKFPDTPTSVDSLHYLQKKLLPFEKRESGTEESLDGSVVSEMECGDPVLSIERLKAALKAERKALSALYAELEEERSASAVAANQTMAMITRLQEEKAAMQMEALQYQRMMDEQSEYDQEALQLLNELMIKREKEKQELEKELEIYRKKVVDYEAKDKMRMTRRSRDGSVRSRNSSASCSNVEDNDELSIDLNHEARDEDSSYYGHQESSSNSTPTDAVLNLEEMALDCVKHMSSLDESLTEFEEERLSILDQLKLLEEKLLTLGDDEFIEDVKSINQSSIYIANGFDENHNFSSEEQNAVSNEFSKDMIYSERKTMASMAKNLLPLLDATENETEEGLLYEEQVESESVERQNSSFSNFDMDNKKLAFEEEVDHVYERLQALEADREFLKHCMSSIKKGDKGMDLLQEILQHLRDLRAVELRVRNMSDDPLG